MTDEASEQIAKLQHSLAQLDAQQRELGLDFSAQMAQLQQRLLALQGGDTTTPTIQNTGSGAVGMDDATVAGQGAVAVRGSVYGDIILGAPATPPPLEGLRAAYLTWLMAQVRAVPLAGIDPKSISEETRRDLDLAAVYTALMTQRTDLGEAGLFRLDKDRLDEPPKPLSALEVLNAESHLALLGDPGGGKSTFVNFVALCLAGEGLGHPEANLALLAPPVLEKEEKEKPPLWAHGALLPVRVILRDFVARGLAGSQDRLKGDVLWHFMLAELPETLRDFGKPLRDEWVKDGGLLLLDGLDEVPEAEHRRDQVKAVVAEFVAAFPQVRVLVTSRTYAYQRQDWKLPGFAEATLAPFGPEQIRRFVTRWYAYVGLVRKLSAEDAQGRAALLIDVIERSANLTDLARRPLLLTLMASLHAWRGGSLPDKREALYAEAVDLLLNQWENQKRRRNLDGTDELIQPSLSEWLNVDPPQVRALLNRLAFEAHRDQPLLTGTADIAQDKLVSGLLDLGATHPDVRPQRLVEYLSQRAGVLEPRGVGVYAFPHRTFQEYLAACYLTEGDDFPDNVAELFRAEPNRWREVAQLAGAKAATGAAAQAWALAEALCFNPPVAPYLENQAEYWGALLAAQVLIENHRLAMVSAPNRLKLERIRRWLTLTLQRGALPHLDRAQAGDALGVLGDPRFRAEAWQLPDEPLLGFVEIPAGPFLMGSDPARDKAAQENEQPQHRVTLPTYFIARYPVTVAQYHAFVEATGYDKTPEPWQRDLPNRPVCWVTWYNALAYCDWLNETLKNSPYTPAPLAHLLTQEGWRVTLPSEAEWEKAARGDDGRIYPWVDERDLLRANTREAGLNDTSAVGCFPGADLPYGLLDMSGNVWEWTLTIMSQVIGKEKITVGEQEIEIPKYAPVFGYPYDANDGRNDVEKGEEFIRVVRGGSWLNLLQGARAAFRVNFLPDGRFDSGGFRICVRPPSL